MTPTPPVTCPCRHIVWFAILTVCVTPVVLVLVHLGLPWWAASIGGAVLMTVPPKPKWVRR